MSHATNNTVAPSVGAITESVGPAGALLLATGSALKSACPFCGSSNVLLDVKDISMQAIECQECGARGPVAGEQHDAWKYWNGGLTLQILQGTCGSVPNTQVTGAAQPRSV